MDSDDVALAPRLTQQIQFLLGHADVVAVGCAFDYIDPEGRVLATRSLPLTHEEIDARHMRGESSGLLHPAMTFRRDAARSIGGYQSHLEWVEDYDIYLRFAEVGKLANLSEVLMRYRLRETSITSTRAVRQAELLATAWREAHKRRGLIPSVASPAHGIANVDDRRMFRSYWATLAMGDGHWITARKNAWRGAWRHPFLWWPWKVFVDTLRSGDSPRWGRWISYPVSMWAIALQVPRRLRLAVRRAALALPFIWRLSRQK